MVFELVVVDVPVRVKGPVLERNGEAVILGDDGDVLEGMTDLDNVGVAVFVLDCFADNVPVGLELEVLELLTLDVPVFDACIVFVRILVLVVVELIRLETVGCGDEDDVLLTVELRVDVCVPVIVFVEVPDKVFTLDGNEVRVLVVVFVEVLLAVELIVGSIIPPSKLRDLCIFCIWL